MTIEVKTYSPSEGAKVWISDPMQLEPDHGVPLILACQELARSEDRALVLAGHVDRICRALGEDALLVTDYQDLLAGRGYLPAHAPLYAESFRLGALRSFSVSNNFPRILPAEVPPGVGDVKFSVSLSAIEPFRVSSEERVGPVVASSP
jgi:hypothetical protein